MADANALGILKSAIDNGRIDVLRSGLAELSTGSKKTFTDLIDKPNFDGESLLHYATEKNDVDAVRTLLLSGANPCVQNKNGKTPYQISSKEEIKKVFVHELLQAVAQSKLGRVCQLISSGVPVDCVDELHIKNTPLHWAACFGDENVLRVLCDGGCNVNSQNSKGDTPLHDAVRRNNMAIVEKLLSYGARLDLKNSSGVTCLDLAQETSNRTEVARRLNLHFVASEQQKSLKRTNSVSSLTSEISLLSSPSNENRVSSFDVNLQRVQRDAIDRDHALSLCNLESDDWHELLWPKPQRLSFFNSTAFGQNPKSINTGFMVNGCTSNVVADKKIFTLPDRHLRVFPLIGSYLGGLAFEQLWEYFRLPLADLRIALEPEYQTNFLMAERVSGVYCGVFPQLFQFDNQYRLRIDVDSIQLTAKDELGLWYGIMTLLQCLRIAQSFDQNTLSLPNLLIDDWPDTKYRGVLIDFTGCRTYNLDTLCKMAADLCRIKANQLVLHFEVRVQDLFSLPYSQKDLFRLKQYCGVLKIDLVPALDLNGEEADPKVVDEILRKFFDRFTGCATFFYFGSNLCKILLRNPTLLSQWVPYRIEKVYLSLKDPKDLVEFKDVIRFLPPQCIVAAFDEQLEEDGGTSPRSVCLKLSNCEVGYLCSSPDDVLSNAQKINRHQALSVIVCDLVSGCEIVPRSFSLLNELFSLGAAWNRRQDASSRGRSFHRLPLLCAEHVCGNRSVAPLFREIFALGHLERRLTQLMTSYDVQRHLSVNAANNVPTTSSTLTPNAERRSIAYVSPQSSVENGFLTNGGLSPKIASSASSSFVTISQRRISRCNFEASKPRTISIFVQLLLNPNFIDLEQLTPVAFKKVRLELQRCLRNLNDLKNDIPYNYELALSVAEVQLITELMILTSKIGQSLCLVGANPNQNFGSSMVNVGVTNLMLTSRTDLANKLLEIRNQFQPAWLSRNLPSTLPNALKIFDNLFKTLLPPNLQQLGEKLL